MWLKIFKLCKQKNKEETRSSSFGENYRKSELIYSQSSHFLDRVNILSNNHWSVSPPFRSITGNTSVTMNDSLTELLTERTRTKTTS